MVLSRNEFKPQYNFVNFLGGEGGGKTDSIELFFTISTFSMKIRQLTILKKYYLLHL